MLVRKRTAYAFDEILGGSFNRVRIVVGGMAGLGGILVASDVADVISVDPIQLDDLFGGSKKNGPGFVGDEDGVDKVAKGVLEKEETVGSCKRSP